METLDHFLHGQFRLRPDSMAVQLNDDTWTFHDVESFSNRFARALVDAGIRRGDRVAFLMKKSPIAIAGIFGILKAGAAYVAIDRDYSTERVTSIIQAAKPAMMLVDGANHESVRRISSLAPSLPLKTVWMGSTAVPATLSSVIFKASDLPSVPATPMDTIGRADDLACILYSSGPTGALRPAAITHSKIRDLVDWAIPYFRISSSDRCSGHAGLHSELSVFDIFGSVAAGAQLHLVSPELNQSPLQLTRFIREMRLTQWVSIASVLHYIARFDVLQPADFQHLKRVLWSGDALSAPVLRYWTERLPHVVFAEIPAAWRETALSAFPTQLREQVTHPALGGGDLFVKPIDATA